MPQSGSLLRMVRMLDKHPKSFVFFKDGYAHGFNIPMRKTFGTRRLRVTLRRSKRRSAL